MNESQYDDLIGKIYDAALMPELWPVFLERMSDALGSRGTVLYLVDFASRSSTCRSDEISFIQSVRIDPEAVASYDHYYSKINVWLEHSGDLPEGELITTDRLYSACELVKTEWYNDWLKPQGYFHAMLGHLLKRDRQAVRLSVFRPRQRPFSNDEMTLFGRLVPHLRRSCMIHTQFSEVKSVQSVATDLLHRLPLGLILFDQSGQAVFANQMAESLMRDGFYINASGRCMTGNVHDTRALRQLICDALEFGESHAMSLHGNSFNRPLSVIAVSLHKHSLPFIASGPSVALFVCDPARPLVLDDKLLAQCYGLSPAEAKLAVALLQGQTPAEYAEIRGISSNTVKTQLKQVLAKTGTHRQSELIQLLTTCFGLFAAQVKPALSKN